MARTSGRSRKPDRFHYAAARRRLAAKVKPQPRREAGLVADANVIEALPNAMFTLELESGHRLIGYTGRAVAARAHPDHARRSGAG
jgi:hypothetical protein